MTPEVVSYGEILIDFSQHGMGPLGFPAYEALPGGGVANMVVALARWGRRVAFAGRAGGDAMGALLRRTLTERGIDDSRLLASTLPTTMAIVSLDPHGDRSFDFLWKGTSCDGIPVCVPDAHAAPKIFHFSSVSMSDPVGRANNLASVRLHKAAGSLISFDPNLRRTLWPRLNEAGDAIGEGLGLSDLVKISEEEVAFALGEPEGDPAEQGRRLRAKWNLPVVFVTLGGKGCLWIHPEGDGAVAAPAVKVVDTTGAGDCFMAGVLHRFLEIGKVPRDLTRADVASLAAFGVAAGSASTTKRGGIPSIPTLDEIQTLRPA